MRPLSPEESDLWCRVTASIRPLSSERAEARQPDKKPRVLQAQRPTAAPGTAAPNANFAAHRPGTLDSTWDRKLRTGAVEPDRVVDLHGMNLDTAWQSIDRALERAINHGERVVLLITGHHRPGAPTVERGKIRAAVHDWLAASRHAPQIAAVRGASGRHGGGGSLYLVLRRR